MPTITKFATGMDGTQPTSNWLNNTRVSSSDNSYTTLSTSRRVNHDAYWNMPSFTEVVAGDTIVSVTVNVEWKVSSNQAITRTFALGRGNTHVSFSPNLTGGSNPLTDTIESFSPSLTVADVRGDNGKLTVWTRFNRDGSSAATISLDAISVTVEYTTTNDGIAPSSLLDIGPADGQNHFELQYARSGDPSWSLATQTQIATGFEEFPVFYTTGEVPNKTRFYVKADAPGISGSTPRTELREVNADGTAAAFNALSGTHEMYGRSTVVHGPAAAPDIVFAQLHNGDVDRVSLRTQLVSGTVRGRIRVNGTSVHEWANPYVEGTEVEWLIRVISGELLVFINDMTTPAYTAPAGTLTATAGVNTWYFKAGCYLQTDSATVGTSEYGSVDLRSLRVKHSTVGTILFPPAIGAIAGGGTGVTTTNVPYPSVVRPNDLLLIGISARSQDLAFSAPGWNEKFVQGGDFTRFTFLWKIATASDVTAANSSGSVTVTGPDVLRAMKMMAFSGVDVANPFDQAETKRVGDAAVADPLIIIPSQTPTVVGCTPLWGLTGFHGTGVTWQPTWNDGTLNPPGNIEIMDTWQELGSGNYRAGAIYAQPPLIDTSPSGSRGGTPSTPATSSGIFVLLRPVPSAAPPAGNSPMKAVIGGVLVDISIQSAISGSLIATTASAVASAGGGGGGGAPTS